MSARRRLLGRYLSRLPALAPAGYTVGAHVRFAKPLFLRSTYPDAWHDSYRRLGFAMRDPLVFWGVGNTGAIRWSEVALPDPFDVMGKAAEHGLRFGAVAAAGKITSRTILGVARGDRELTDDELTEVLAIADGIHDVAGDRPDLTEAELGALRGLGAAAPQAADAGPFALPDTARDARLSAARDKLGAETTAEALRMAKDYRLI